MPWTRLRRFRLVFILTLVALFVFVELLRYRFFPALDSWTGRVLMDLVVLAGAIFVFGGGFDLLETMQRRLDRQERELTAIHRGVEEIYGAVSLREVLQKVTDRAAELSQARYGTLVLANELHEITQVVTTGLDAEQRKRLRLRPEGAGILSLALATTEPFRIDDFRRDAPFGRRLRRRLGLRSLLVVPLDCKEPLRGRLLVADKTNDRPFTPRDEETLIRFATAAALAIDNAQLNERLRTLALAEERERIGGEIHDGMAQILAYVNAKAQAVSGFMAHGRAKEARVQLDQLATAARIAYTDAREGILALRTQPSPGRPFRDTLKEFLSAWERQSSITAQLEMDGDIDVDPMVELQLLRIVQEALANTRKHSGADRVSIRLVRDDDILEVDVEDDGRGFDPAALARSSFPRFGLSIMKERTESVGGRMEIDSAPGRGARVHIEIPLEGQLDARLA